MNISAAAQFRAGHAGRSARPTRLAPRKLLDLRNFRRRMMCRRTGRLDAHGNVRFPPIADIEPTARVRPKAEVCRSAVVSDLLVLAGAAAEPCARIVGEWTTVRQPGTEWLSRSCCGASRDGRWLRWIFFLQPVVALLILGATSWR